MDNIDFANATIKALYEQLKMQGGIGKRNSLVGISTISNDPIRIFKQAVRAINSIAKKYGWEAEGDINDKAEIEYTVESGDYRVNTSYSFIFCVLDEDAYSQVYVTLLVHDIPRNSGIKGCFVYIRIDVVD